MPIASPDSSRCTMTVTEYASWWRGDELGARAGPPQYLKDWNFAATPSVPRVRDASASPTSAQRPLGGAGRRGRRRGDHPASSTSPAGSHTKLHADVLLVLVVDQRGRCRAWRRRARRAPRVADAYTAPRARSRRTTLRSRWRSPSSSPGRTPLCACGMVPRGRERDRLPLQSTCRGSTATVRAGRRARATAPRRSARRCPPTTPTTPSSSAACCHRRVGRARLGELQQLYEGIAARAERRRRRLKRPLAGEAAALLAEGDGDDAGDVEPPSKPRRGRCSIIESSSCRARLSPTTRDAHVGP